MNIARANRGVQKPSSELADANMHESMRVHLDLSGRLIDASATFIEHSSQTVEQMRGLALENYLDPASRREFSDCLIQIASGKTAATRIHLRFYNGQAFDAEMCADGDAQKPSGITLLIHLSDDKINKLEPQPESTRAMLLRDIEKINHVMYVLDTHGICQCVNRAIEKYHIAPAEISGCHYAEFIAPEDRERVGRIFERILQGHIEVVEFSLINSAGEKFPIRSYNQPEFDRGQVTGLSGLLIDGGISTDYRQMLERRAAQLAVLNRIGQELFLTVDLDEILSHAVQMLQSSFGYFHVAVFQPDPQHKHPVMAARAGSISTQFPQKHALARGQGLIGWVFEHHQTVVANNVSLDPRYINFYPERIPTRSELVVPIQTGEQFFGVLDAQSPLENAFDQNDVSVFETVSRQLALGIENANLYHQVALRLQQQERAEGLMRLQRDLLAGLSTKNDFSDVLSVVLDTLTRIEGIDGGSIYLVDETGGLDMVAHKGLTPAFAAAVSYLPPEAHKTQFVLRGVTAYMHYANLPFDPRIPADVRSKENILGLAVLPILDQSTVIADLTLCSHTLKDIPQDARVILESVAAQLGATIARIKTEKALAANQAHSTALLEAVPDMILVVDASGRFHRVKQGVDTASYGLPDDILGKQIQQFLPRDDANFVLGMVREALASRQTKIFSYKLFSEQKQRSEFFEARVSAVNEELAIVIIRNDTSRRLAELEIENRDRKYRALFDLNKDAVFLYSIDGSYLESNQQAERLLGYAPGELLGMTYLQLVVPEEQDLARQRFAALQAGEIFPVYERTFVHKDGTCLPCEVNIAVVLDAVGRPLHIQSILRDISQHKQADLRRQHVIRLDKTYCALLTRIVQGDDLGNMIPDVLREAATCLDAAGSHLLHKDFKDRATIRYVEWPAVMSAPKESMPQASGDFASMWADLTGHDRAVLDALAVDSAQSAPPVPLILEKMVIAPVYAAGSLFGILTIQGRMSRTAWLDEEIDFMRNLAAVLGRKVECG